MKAKNVLQIAIVFILISIVIGAFGAHALKEKLTDDQASSLEVGIRYMMYHGLALFGLVYIAKEWNLALNLVYRLLIVGVLFFSGSIFALTFQHISGIDLKFIWPLTPIGGLLLIIAWLLVLIQLFKNKKSEN